MLISIRPGDGRSRPGMTQAAILALTLLAESAPLHAAPETDETQLRSIPVVELAVEPARSEAAASDEPREADATTQLDDIVVTGEKIERLLSETTSSVQVLRREVLEDSSMEDLYDVLARTANVNETAVNIGRSGGFAIRGINDTGVGSQSFGSTSDLATIVLDEVALTGAGNRAGPLDLWDAESIELFRGPQSTNQGRNALAGAIVMRTRDPDGLPELRARAGIARFGGEQYAAAVGTPQLGPFAVRVAAQSLRTEGSVYNTTRDEPADFRERETVRAKLALLPGQWGDFSALLSFSQGDDLNGQPRVSGDPRQRQSVAFSPEQYDATSRLGSLRLNVPLGDWELVSVSAIGETRLDQIKDYTGDAAEDGEVLNLVDDETYSQELRLEFGGPTLLDGVLRGVLGAYAARVDGRRDTQVVDGASNIGIGNVYVDGLTEVDDRQDAAALFGEAEWEFRPQWNLIGGARYDTQTVEFGYLSEYNAAFTRDDRLNLGDVIGDQLGPSFGLPADGSGAGRIRSAVLLPKLGLRYDGADDRWSSGLTLQRAYRAGGLSVNFARGEFAPVDAEHTWTGEWSLRVDWLQRRLSTRANVYYTDWRDQQVTVQLSDDPNDSQTENAGASHLYGFELEADWRMAEGLDAFVSAGLARTRFDEFDVTLYDRDAQAYVTVSYAGNAFPGAPQRQGALGLRYNPQGHGLLAQWDVSYVGSAFRQADNNPEQRSDAYTLLNARLGWEHAGSWGSGGVYLSGRNLLDRFYVTQRADGYFIVGDPRTLMLDLELRF
ncbi:MAG TPA: TonB-dependent receptor [Fontimonas sp.]